MKNLLGGSASVFALALGAAGLTGAWAQEEDEDERAADVIIVTGSAIAGAAESAALPVEVYTAEESFLQGNQTAIEFIKSLSIVGSTLSETNQFTRGYGGIGASDVNLRGLGAGRTLVIMNGRRFTENANMIPQIALARTEVLKDGAATIYGADATGGVVNFITRDSFDGLITEAEYKVIDGSDGDWGVGALWGRDFDNGNLMFSLEWEHRGELPMVERDWAVREFSENDTPWAPYGSYAAYGLVAAPTVRPFIHDPVTNPFGWAGVVADFTPEECEAMNGPISGVPATLSGFIPVCWWNYAIGTYNLVEEIDQYRAFAQVKNELAENLEFTGTVAYGKSTAEDIGTVSAYQFNDGPGPVDGAFLQYRVPATNPFFADFLAQNNVPPASAAVTVGADLMLPGGVGAQAGVPHLGAGGTSPSTEIENWNVAGILDGDFGDFVGGFLDTWQLAGSYNLTVNTASLPDTISYRVQEALNGFGGPDCNAEDLVPDDWDALHPSNFDADGTAQSVNDLTTIEQEALKDAFYATVGTQNPAAAGVDGCMYWNPFASSFAGHHVFGNPNPRHIPGNENSAELSQWLYDDRANENHNGSLTIDALLTGAVPLELPGGQVAWAAGAQWRQQENREHSPSDFNDSDVTPCQWPGQQPGDVGCAPIGTSPYNFFAQDGNSRTDQQQFSYFGELQVPVLDTLDFQLAVRREDFSSDLGATVYKVAGRWQPTDWIALRGSFGTNYAAPPANLIPGEVTTGLSLVDAAGKYVRASFETLPEIQPETAEVGNFGAILTFDEGLPGDGAFRASADFWTFEIIDEIKTINPNAIADSVVASQFAFVDCSAPLIERVSFFTGPGAAGCAQGVTTGNDINGVTSVRGNGPGAITEGFDYSVNYTFDALGGDVLLDLTATQITTYEIQAFVLEGVQISPFVDGLGFANYSRDGDLVSKWRGNATVNYAVGDHNLRYVLRYIQGVEDDREPLDSPARQIDDFVTSNLYYQYRAPFLEDLVLSLSVENIFDEDPPFTLQQYSYDPDIGNPLGRTFEVGIRKTF